MSRSARRRLWTALVLGAFPHVFLGCGVKSKPGFVPVSGVVTFDGEPVSEGFISFEDQAGSYPPESTPIVGGRYQLDARPGVAIVRITASRQVANQDPKSPNPPQWVDYIPDTYNTASKLTADVQKNGDNRVDFALQSISR